MKYHHSNATRMIVERYRDFVHRNLNIHNVKLYIDAFNKSVNDCLLLFFVFYSQQN
jgi:hypothetical protein